MAAIMLMCAGCGNKHSDEGYGNYDNAYAVAEDAEEKYDTNEYYDESTEAGFSDMSTTGTSSSSSASNDDSSTIDKEMLVYRGDIRVDTLDFNSSVELFRSIIKEKGGFIENESYSDSKSTNSYYRIDDEDKHNIYTATVRVPSSNYDTVMNSATDLGDVRSKSSNVTNVTREYGTYKSQLEIYEAEYSRYLTLLENATDDEYALKIENELFDIQIQIANLKSGITNIENDVAYSYIDIVINEVTEYKEEPEKTDTFFDRFKNTCKNSWSNFLDAMETLLFFIINNIYWMVILAAITIIVIKILKKTKVKRLENKQMKMQMRMQMNNRMGAPINAPMNGPVNGPMNAPIRRPINAPVNGPVNVPMNGPVNAPINSEMERPVNNNQSSDDIQNRDNDEHEKPDDKQAPKTNTVKNRKNRNNKKDTTKDNTEA